MARSGWWSNRTPESPDWWLTHQHTSADWWLQTDATGTGPGLRTTFIMDPSMNVYQERTGAIDTLTVAGIGDPVGTWADATGTYIFRAPSDAARMTLATVDGETVLQKTAVGQYYESDDAASTWAWLHDGTKYSMGCVFQIAYNTAGAKLFPVWSSEASSSANKGAAIVADDRTGVNAEFDNAVRVEVMNGTGSQPPVAATVRPGVLPGRWNSIVALMDPGNAAAASRANVYSFGRSAVENDNTFTPTTDAPTSNMTIGAYGGAAASASYDLGYIGHLIFYQGTWDSGEISLAEQMLDYSSAGRYSLTRRANISGQATVYEAFPRLFRLANGNLLGLYRSGATHQDDKGTITSAISSNSGRSWTVTADAITHATLDLRDPAGLVLANGDVIVGNSIYTPSTSPGSVQISKSTDNGATFSTIATVAPNAGFDWTFPWGKWKQLASGKILATWYSKKTSDAKTYTEVWESDSPYTTWTLRSTVGADLNEASLFNLAGEVWVIACRHAASSPIQTRWAVSVDNCSTWGSLVTSIEGVAPEFFMVGDTVACVVGDRNAPTGLRVAPYADLELHGHDASWLIYDGNGEVDLGYASCEVTGNRVDMLSFDDEIADNGVFYQRFQYPNFNQYSYRSLESDSALEGHWVMRDDAANTTVVDETGTQDGTLVSAGNSADITIAGPITNLPKGLDLDGINDSIDCGAASLFTAPQNTLVFTIAFWMKLDATTARKAICGSTNTSAAKGFWVAYEHGVGAGTNAIRFTAWNGAPGTVIDFRKDSIVTDTNWHHVAVVSTSAADAGVIYVDGVDVGALTYASSFGTLATGDATNGFDIGVPGVASLNFAGGLSDFWFFSRALTNKEIWELYKGPR